MEVENSIRLLEVTITDTLSWSKHIETIQTKAGRKVGLIRKAAHVIDSNGCLQIYKSHIRPCLEYCSIICGGSSQYQLSVLYKIESKCLRALKYSSINNVQLVALQHRRDVAAISNVYRILSKEAPEKLQNILPPKMIYKRPTRQASASNYRALKILRLSNEHAEHVAFQIRTYGTSEEL